jgi:hypothetical protein
LSRIITVADRARVGYRYTMGSDESGGPGDDRSAIGEQYGLHPIEGAVDYFLTVDPEWRAEVERRRLACGIKQKPLSVYIGVSQPAISNCLSGKLERSEAVHRLSLAFGVELPPICQFEIEVEEWRRMGDEHALANFSQHMRQTREYLRRRDEQRNRRFPPKK